MSDEEQIISVSDALDIFSLPPDFSINDLKAKYRSIALRVHPDRGGTAQLFRTVNECFELLCLEHRSRAGGATHDQLRRDFDADVSRMDATSRRKVDNDNFDIVRFNSVFEETRVADEIHDTGYGDWIRSDDSIEKKSVKLNPKCSGDAFNRAFDKAVPVAKENKSIIVRPVDLMCGSTLALTEIGAQSVDDYSMGGGFDCRLAHSSGRIANPDPCLFDSSRVLTPDQVEARRTSDLERGLSLAEERELERENERQRMLDDARRGVEMTKYMKRAEAHSKANRMFLTGESSSYY
nr:DnaJ domain-containing protein [Oceanusvirus sp.]